MHKRLAQIKNMNRINFPGTGLFFSLLACMFLAACVPQKKIVYFQDRRDGSDTSSPAAPKKIDLKIYPKDIISVVVYTDNPEALPGIGSSIDNRIVDNRAPYEKGFTVDDSGNLTLPLIGNIQVAGLSVDNAKKLIVEKYKTYIPNPVVVIKKLSFKISVLGEVTHPGVFYIQNESVTLIEGLSLAGDITKFGSHTDVKVIRSINGRQEEYVIDLTDRNALYSPVFYLMQDDVIYVRPRRGKAFADISPQVSIITSVLSVGVAVATLLIVRAQK